MKSETQGIDPKVPAQALAVIIAFFVSYFGVDLTAEVSAAISVVLGVIIAYVAPAAKTAPAKTKRSTYDRGYTLVEVGIFLLLLAVAAAIVFAFIH